MSALSATVTLTSYNMGDATRDDYSAWIAYVCEHIDERVGAEVGVEAENYGRGPDRDVVRVSGHESSDDETAAEALRETIREALRDMWDAWCAEGAPGAQAQS